VQLSAYDIQGPGAGYLPSILDVKLLDEVIKVNNFFVQFIFLIVLRFFFIGDKF
jgi:hypothetical protein